MAVPGRRLAARIRLPGRTRISPRNRTRSCMPASWNDTAYRECRLAAVFRRRPDHICRQTSTPRPLARLPQLDCVHRWTMAAALLRLPLLCRPATLNFNPKGRDYSSVTASNFYPFVLAQLWHWTGRKEEVAPYLDAAVRALRWLQTADLDADGFVEYQTRSPQGPKNLSWKDSGDAMVYEEGSQVPTPIATCEEQGILYASRLNMAEVLWWFDRKDEAKALHQQAIELKKRINDTFWMPDLHCFAMALDPQKRQVRSIASNPIHCVVTGIAERTLALQTLDRMVAHDMFSGWGIRTLSAEHPAYDPYSYHRGSVWPVEHGPFAVALYRYGEHGRLRQLCQAQFELASLFEQTRLPECVSGHPRDAGR